MGLIAPRRRYRGGAYFLDGNSVESTRCVRGRGGLFIVVGGCVLNIEFASTVSHDDFGFGFGGASAKSGVQVR